VFGGWGVGGWGLRGFGGGGLYYQFLPKKEGTRSRVTCVTESGWERGADSVLGRGLREAGPWCFGGRAALLGL
jgi:hypothetical protein